MVPDFIQEDGVDKLVDLSEVSASGYHRDVIADTSGMPPTAQR